MSADADHATLLELGAKPLVDCRSAKAYLVPSRDVIAAAIAGG